MNATAIRAEIPENADGSDLDLNGFLTVTSAVVAARFLLPAGLVFHGVVDSGRSSTISSDPK